MLKSLILLFVHLISLCCPVLFQARPIDSLDRTSILAIVWTYIGGRSRAYIRIIASEASLLHELAGAFLWYIY